MVGATFWLYAVIHQVTKEEVIKAIGEVAIGARTTMAQVAGGGVPKGILPLAGTLMTTVSHRVFETKDPALCLQMSDATHNISKTLKSLILVPMFAASGM